MENGMFLCFYFIEFDLDFFMWWISLEGCVIWLVTEDALRKLAISDSLIEFL